LTLRIADAVLSEAKDHGLRIERVLLAGALAMTACKLDSFLAVQQKLDTYTLPGNTIPSNLIEPVSFQSEGHTLYGFWVRPAGGRPGITILYFHGNKHNIDEYWDRVMFLHDVGVNVFVFDYRGFGKSEGAVTSEAGLHADGQAALQYVLSRPGVSPDSVGFYGYSLGNIPAIFLAAQASSVGSLPSAAKRPLFLVAESPFASAASLAQGSLALSVPGGWLTDDRFDNVAQVRGIRTPLLLIHGEDDDFVRYRDNGRVVFEAAPQPKKLVLVPGAVHDDVPQKMGLAAYRAEIINWINQSVPIQMAPLP
jgi:hypothetical protein